jgi:hypothetical protein
MTAFASQGGMNRFIEEIQPKGKQSQQFLT